MLWQRGPQRDKRGASPGDRVDLVRDERGAMLVIAVFFAIFAVSMLYLGIGAAETVLFREHLQDTADSAALSGAVTQARLMNIVVLINLVMAALVAILLTLKLVEGFAIVGIAIAAGLAFFTAGSSLAFIPPLNALRSTMAGIYEELKPGIFEVLKVLNDVSDKIVEVGPAAGKLVALTEIEGSGANANARGFAAVSGEDLPLRNDDYSKLCKNAGKLVRSIAEKPFAGIPGVGTIMHEALSPVDSLAEAMSEWFCGDGGYNMPDLGQEISRGFPVTDAAAACEAEDNPVDVPPDQAKYERSDSCDSAAAENLAAKPDARGECQTDCEPDGPYYRIVEQARRECEPSADPRPTEFRYQLQTLRVWYTWNGTKWVKSTPEIRRSEVVAAATQPPCGPSDVHPTVAVGYQLELHPPNDPTRVQVVCSAEKEPQLPEIEPDVEGEKPKRRPDPILHEYDQVPQIFGCKRKLKKTVATKEAKDTRDVAGDEKSPKRIRRCLALGSERFQVRTVVFGDAARAESARLVRLGLWGNADPTNPLELLRNFGGFAVAQSEYYYAGPSLDSPEAWMWNMGWKARLRRFDVTEEDSEPSKCKKDKDEADVPAPMETVAKGCAEVDPVACGKALGMVELMKDSIVH